MSDDSSSSSLIPEPLLQDFHKGDSVLFLGTNFPNLHSDEVPPGRSAFAARLAQNLPEHVMTGANPWGIAQLYGEQANRHILSAALKEWLEETGRQSYSIYATVARLPIKAIITTAYDDRLKRALCAAGVCRRIVCNV